MEDGNSKYLQTSQQFFNKAEGKSMTARYTEELQPYVQNYIKERTFFQCHCNLQETQNLKLRKNLFSEADESVGECIWGSNTLRLKFISFRFVSICC
jgi:hypothetical protein